MLFYKKAQVICNLPLNYKYQVILMNITIDITIMPKVHTAIFWDFKCLVENKNHLQFITIIC